MFFTNNYEFKNEILRTKTPEKPEPIRIPDNLLILTGQLWNLFQDLSTEKIYNLCKVFFPVKMDRCRNKIEKIVLFAKCRILKQVQDDRMVMV
ncbi:MAG: hypothetical protein LBK53_01025 [Heliobacteriaceae bacterium]|jgi:hypothetical protein|nr:hypothetical protein [Heliobacteriaceae bacterium]